MKHMRQVLATLAIIATCLLGLAPAAAQSCTTGAELNPAVKAALENAAQQYFQMAQQGNAAALQQNATFQVGDLLAGNKEVFTGNPTRTFVYLFDNSQPGASAEFFCGVYPNLVGFRFGTLPSGQYAVVVQDIAGGKAPARVSWILQKSGTAWKVGGLYPKSEQVAGHDYAWFVTQARAYKARGQYHNAWFYYVVANDLMRPFPAVTNNTLDKLYDEMQQVLPKDLPLDNPVDLTAQVCGIPTMTAGAAAGTANCAPKTFKLTQVFPTPVGDNLDLVVKYQEPDISDTTRTYQSNVAVIKGLVAKYPELREAFAGVVARAVAPNGQDYGTLLAMKDVK